MSLKDFRNVRDRKRYDFVQMQVCDPRQPGGARPVLMRHPPSEKRLQRRLAKAERYRARERARRGFASRCAGAIGGLCAAFAFCAVVWTANAGEWKSFLAGIIALGCGVTGLCGLAFAWVATESEEPAEGEEERSGA